MEKSIYTLKKEQKAEMIKDALLKLQTATGLSKLVRSNLKDKIKTGNANSIKSALNSIHISQNININENSKKSVTLDQIKKQKTVNNQLKGVNAFDSPMMGKVVHLLSRFKNKSIKQLNYKANGNRFVQVMIKEKLTRKQILDYGNKISNLFFDNNRLGQMCIATRSDAGWRNGLMRDFGEEPNMYDPDEYGETLQNNYQKTCFYFVEKGNRPSKKGGASDDKKNNCLWEVINRYLNSKNPFKEPSDLKKYLKVHINAPIDIADMPKIEKALKTFKINVTGDHTYTSPITTLKSIDIKLLNGHYVMDKSKADENCKYNKILFNNNAKRAIMHNKFTTMAYDGKIHYKMTNDEYYKRYEEYVIIQQDYNSKLTLKEDYDIFVHDANMLIKETNGIINLYKTGDTNSTILNLFDRYTKHIPNADHIGQVEADWITQSSTGALTFGIPYVGPAYKYDFKSNYPSIMKSSQTFPIKAGEFQLITDKEFRESDAYFKYGIFRCVVLRSGDYSIDKLFRFNNKNKYTHIDLNNAKLLGLDIQLIEDGDVNFLHYSRDKLLSGNELFGEYVDLLFKLKQLKIPRAKIFLNNLWGLLSQTNEIKTRCNHKEGGVIQNMDMDGELIGMKPYDDNETIIQTVNKSKRYIRGFARIKPFILARGRALLAKTILPFKDIVYRCMTDSFICSEKPPNVITGTGLGDLVLEYQATKIQIKNCRKEIILIN
jgi:hypothetical protein